MTVQTACDRCSQGVMDAGNDHLHGRCKCSCHSGEARPTPVEPEARPLDENGEWMIRHLRCEWGIRTPQECNQINDPCVPCALRLWLDGIPTLDEDARAALAAAKARADSVAVEPDGLPLDVRLANALKQQIGPSIAFDDPDHDGSDGDWLRDARAVLARLGASSEPSIAVGPPTATPRPWTVDIIEGGGWAVVVDADDEQAKVIAELDDTYGDRAANASLIVEAVNAYGADKALAAKVRQRITQAFEGEYSESEALRAFAEDGWPGDWPDVREAHVNVERLAWALEHASDPDEPSRSVVPTGYSTMLSREIPAVRRRQAELVADKYNRFPNSRLASTPSEAKP
jgi:hypothetical protein